MQQIINTINNLIVKAKENKAINHITFLKSFKGDFAQLPVTGYLAIVKINEIVKSHNFVGGYVKDNFKGEVLDVSFSIIVYSGSDISGEELSSSALTIQQAVLEADNNLIESYNMGSIEFDNNLKSLYREITFKLSLCLCGEQ